MIALGVGSVMRRVQGADVGTLGVGTIPLVPGTPYATAGRIPAEGKRDITDIDRS